MHVTSKTGSHFSSDWTRGQASKGVIAGLCFDSHGSHLFVRKCLHGDLSGMDERDLAQVPFFGSLKYEEVNSGLPRFPIAIARWNGNTIHGFGGACACDCQLCVGSCRMSWISAILFYRQAPWEIHFVKSNREHDQATASRQLRPQQQEHSRSSSLVAAHLLLRPLLAGHEPLQTELDAAGRIGQRQSYVWPAASCVFQPLVSHCRGWDLPLVLDFVIFFKWEHIFNIINRFMKTYEYITTPENCSWGGPAGSDASAMGAPWCCVAQPAGALSGL